MMLGLLAKNVVRRPKPLATFSRSMAYWNIEWKPAPYPCTKAEREAAAKRYGLLPSDYKASENDGTAPGDYPDLEPFNEGLRDPWEHYDYYPLKRNYNEPVPFRWEFFTEAGYDPLQQETLYRGQPMWRMMVKLFTPFFILLGIIYIGEQYKFFQPMLRLPQLYNRESELLHSEDTRQAVLSLPDRVLSWDPNGLLSRDEDLHEVCASVCSTIYCSRDQPHRFCDKQKAKQFPFEGKDNEHYTFERSE